MEKHLIAATPILFGNRQYNPGEELPTNDPGYIEAWLEAESAAWKDAEEEKVDTLKSVKARSVTAAVGGVGFAQPAFEAEGDLIGKIPSGKARGVVKERAKRPAKSPE